MAAKSRKRRHGEVATLGSLLLSSLSREQARMIQMAELCTRWSEVVGPLLAGKSAPESLLDGALMIVAANPSYAQEIGMRGGDIASLVREKWSLEVSSVKVRVGKPKTVRKSAGPRRKSSPVKPDPEEIAACRDRIEEIVPRDDIAEGLARLMAQYRKRFGGKES